MVYMFTEFLFSFRLHKISCPYVSILEIGDKRFKRCTTFYRHCSKFWWLQKISLLNSGQAQVFFSLLKSWFGISILCNPKNICIPQQINTVVNVTLMFFNLIFCFNIPSDTPESSILNKYCLLTLIIDCIYHQINSNQNGISKSIQMWKCNICSFPSEQNAGSSVSKNALDISCISVIRKQISFSKIYSR